jgi:hypothetical protein
MGCGTSTNNNVVGSVHSVHRSYATLKAAVTSASAEPPLTERGRQGKQRLDAQYELVAFKCKTLAETTGTGAPLFTQTLAPYLVELTSQIAPVREFDGGWVKLSFPDNGHWKVVQDTTSGLVQLAPAEQLTGVLISLSMGPMPSKHDSRSYSEAMVENLNHLLPRNRRVADFNLAPLRPTTVNGMPFFEVRRASASCAIVLIVCVLTWCAFI